MKYSKPISFIQLPKVTNQPGFDSFTELTKSFFLSWLGLNVSSGQTSNGGRIYGFGKVNGVEQKERRTDFYGIMDWKLLFGKLFENIFRSENVAFWYCILQRC